MQHAAGMCGRANALCCTQPEQVRGVRHLVDVDDDAAAGRADARFGGCKSPARKKRKRGV